MKIHDQHRAGPEFHGPTKADCRKPGANDLPEKVERNDHVTASDRKEISATLIKLLGGKHHGS